MIRADRFELAERRAMVRRRAIIRARDERRLTRDYRWRY